jgi:heme O synthase-like polyprenyltransferase
MRPILRLLRVSLAPTAVSNSAAGVLVAQSDPRASTIALAAGVSICAYSLGMVLNDIADLERDRLLHPDRPLVRGEVSLAAAWLIALGLAAGAVGFSLALGGEVLPIVGLLILAIFAYDFGLKRLSVAGAFAMGAARGLNFLVGFAAGGPGDSTWHPYALVLTCYVTAVTCVSLLEEDPKRWFFVSYTIAAAAAAGVVAYFAALSGGWLGVVLGALVGVAWLVQAVVGFRSFDRKFAMSSVFHGLLLIVPLDAAMVAVDPSKGSVAWPLLALLPVAWGIRRLVSARGPA